MRQRHLVSRFSAVFTVLSSTQNPTLAFRPEQALRNYSSSRMSSTTAPKFEIAQFPCRSDNYGFLLHDPVTGNTYAIDTPCAASYKKVLEEKGWQLTHILNTHRHYDHVDGNLELKTDDVTIIGPMNERKDIPGIDEKVGGGEELELGRFNAVVLDAGGHTDGHVAFYFPELSVLFAGDCLFSLGCGKMFEGTPTQFWSSLERIRGLPDDTMIYCAHEYTESNGKFALSVEPNNQDLIDRMAVVKQRRARGAPTVPTLLGEEKKANPFLRGDISAEIQQNVGITPTDSPSDAFGKLRRAKDNL